MRILFTCRPSVGHYYPMRPLMDALVRSGDEVAVATGRPVLDTAKADGFSGFHVGMDGSAPIVAHHREILASLPPAEIRRHAFTEFFVRAEVPKRAADLIGVVESFQPDLVVHEMAEFAGPLAAASKGIPWATHSFGPLIPPEIALLAGSASADFWEAHGLDPHPRGGLYEHLYLTSVLGVSSIPRSEQWLRCRPSGNRRWPGWIVRP